MIICGYAGIGKSYLAHNFPNVVDLESTPFEKDWDRYFKCAKHYSNQGFLVLLSCHKEIREKVIQLPFDERITIFPCVNDKELFRKRYKQRGNSEEFIKLQMDNWEKWTSESNRLLQEHLEYMESGETLYDAIIRLSKLSPNRFCTYDGCPVNDCSLMKDRCFNPLEKYAKTFAWSEEDERAIGIIKIALEHPYNMEGKWDRKFTLDWLKSLKQRATWKPSKEQIVALRWVLNNIPYNKHKEEISGLLDQIKDL